MRLRLRSTAAALAVFAAIGMAPSLRAETIHGALSRAYHANPDLNAQRATTRATDEAVPQALSGYRPRVTGTVDTGVVDQTTRTRRSTTVTNQFTGQRAFSVNHASVTDDIYGPRGVSVALDQVIYNGGRTGNQVRGAESRVLAARETLRNKEQAVLLNAATAYMNVLRDTAILNLRRNSIEVLSTQLRQTQDRFKVGELTRTDVALSEASLAKARGDAYLAESNLKTSIATYRQHVGDEPKKLSPAQPVEKVLPKSKEAAVAMSQKEHPAIIAALHGVDQQQLQVKVIEGELYPTLSVRALASRRLDSTGNQQESIVASVVGTLSVPIYEGGAVYSRVREAKETLTTQRMTVDLQREAVRQAVVSSWGALETSRAQIEAAQAQVRAAEIALAGVREEAKVGQRTTLDVLTSQQSLLDARVALVSVQRDRVVASYNVLSAIGRLSLRTLGIQVAAYDPKVHYEQVRDKWIGVRTPDGQ
ncbi:MAG TPA: TolC family outer membrane protein [Beijerinckiaceae bacterium]|nr:TolC family outer membrane protein [Beijerinckiaceae bacterium]